MSTTICMAVYSTEENKRAEYTKFTLEMLLRTVDFNKHSLVVSDNGSCKEMHDFYADFMAEVSHKFDDRIEIICNSRNLGTSGAVNKAIKLAREKYGKNQYIIKMDDDCDIIQINWIEILEEVFKREPLTGLAALKRFDLAQHPDHETEWLRSTLRMLPRKHGESWLIVEETPDIIGTCTMFSPALLDKIGFMFQGKLVYGYDDAMQSLRSKLAGFKNCFVPHIPIHHIDKGGTNFIEWKKQYAGENQAYMQDLADEFRSGKMPLYYEPDWNLLA